MDRKNTPTNARDPIAVLTIVLVMTWAVLAGSGWLSYRTYHNTHATTQRRLRIEELRGSIIHLDEVLTMSARMAAATGDPRWEDRYRRFESELDTTIKEAIALAIEAHSSQAAAETDAANIKLVEVENHAFDLVRQGRAEEAGVVLFSDDYESRKQVYAKGMGAFATGLADAVSTTLKREQRLSFLPTGAVLLLTPLLIVGWLVVFRAVNNWKTILAKQAERTEAIENEVAEHKQAEERLRASEERFRTLFENAPLGYQSLDEAGNFIEINEAWCRLLGYAKEEVLGHNFSEFIHPDFAEHFEKDFPTFKKAGYILGAEFEMVRKDGTEIIVSFDGRIGQNEDGSFRQTHCVLSDISMRKRAEQEIQERAAALAANNLALEEFSQATEAANRAKSEFLANMSHEIRTPMTAILGFSDILIGTEMNQEQLDATTTIRRNGEYLIEIINDILDLSKIEAGKLEVEQIQCSPCQVLSEVASLMRVRASEKNLPLEIEFEGPIPHGIQSDPTRLRQILINLAGNAVKFTEVGKVQLVARLLAEKKGSGPFCRNGPKGASHKRVLTPFSQPKMQFDVVDSGIGMTERQMANLFKPFQQADNSTTRKFGGTGLGLTISKRLAEKLGGDITVASTLGEGSTFTVTVETGPLDGVQLLDNPSEAGVSMDLAKKTATPKIKLDCRVLLAEDGPDNQRLISFLLKKAGADVTVAENGRIAHDLALAAQNEGNPFGVILMDMQMPVMDGYEATGKLREAAYAGSIIALTAHAMSTDREKCLAAGCDDYATKPVDRTKLISMVAQYVSREEPCEVDNAPD